MKKRILLFLFVLTFMLPYFVSAYEIQEDWRIRFGGNDRDTFYDILETSDGGILGFGYYCSKDIEGLKNNYLYEALLIKYDKDGNEVWKTGWGGNVIDFFYKAIELDNGDFIVVGYSLSTDIPGFTNNGGYDGIIARYDSDGKELWTKSFGGSSNEEFLDIFESSDGNIIVYGYTMSSDIEDIENTDSSTVGLILKYNLLGDLLWYKGLPGFAKYEPSITENVVETSDGNYVGFSYVLNDTVNYYQDTIITKFDPDGTILWQKNFGGSQTDYARFIRATSDGGIIGAFLSNSTDIDGITNKGSEDILLVRFDKDGEIVWKTGYGGNGYEYVNGLVLDNDNNSYVFGFTQSTDIDNLENKGERDSLLVKFDKDGKYVFHKTFGGNKNDEFLDFVLTQDGGFAISGFYNSTDIEGFDNKGFSDSVYLKYDKNYNLVWSKIIGGNYDETSPYIYELSNGNLITHGSFLSDDIDGLEFKGGYDTFVIKNSLHFDINTLETVNGHFDVSYDGYNAVVTTKANDGYEVDKIIITDSEGNQINAIKINDAYEFKIFDDVSVEVIFKEKIENPKTFDFPDVMICFSFLIICLCGYYYLYFKNNVMEF